MEQFKPEIIKKEHIERALERIISKNIDLIPSTKWDLIFEGKKLPPKEVMRLAHEEATGIKIWERGGGPPTNRYLEKFGYVVKSKFHTDDPVLVLIERYKSYRKENGFDDEIYKWQLLQEFNGRPDINAKDFIEEFININFSNLIYPLGIAVANEIAKKLPEKFRNAFKVLFDDTIEIQERLKYFNSYTLELYREVDPESKKNHHQDERTMATYLSYFDSSKYALFKDSFYQKYCKLLNIKAEKVGNKYVHYLELLKSFVDNYVLKDEELLSLKKLLPEEGVHPDSNHLIFGQDILYKTLDIQVGTERNYWRVGTRDGGTEISYWNDMKNGQFASIGWSEIGDLDDFKIEDKKDVQKLLEKQNYYDKKNVYSRKAGEVFSFYKESKIGDIILAQDGSAILGIGIINDDYTYNSSLDFAHLKPVDWKIIEPNNLSNSEGLRTTFVKLASPDVIMQIENILKNVRKNDGLFNKNTILYGPPGTGKTFHTINKALDICNVDCNGLSREEIKRKYNEKVAEGQIVLQPSTKVCLMKILLRGLNPKNQKRKEITLTIKSKMESLRSFA
jgi:hypothetical protein